jgi:hypothetical protein
MKKVKLLVGLIGLSDSVTPASSIGYFPYS